MSLDDTYDRLVAFEAALARFDEALAASLAALVTCHAALEPVWQDRFAQEYRLLWSELETLLGFYLHGEAPRYRDFVAGKRVALQAYLEGG